MAKRSDNTQFGLICLDRFGATCSQKMFSREWWIKKWDMSILKSSVIQIVSSNGEPAFLVFEARGGSVLSRWGWSSTVPACPTARALVPVMSHVLITFGFWFVCQGAPSAETNKITLSSITGRDLELSSFQNSHLFFLKCRPVW